MSAAIERLAAELMKLSDAQWQCATERWRAGLGWDEVFGPAWEEISERLHAIDFAGPSETDDRAGENADRCARGSA